MKQFIDTPNIEKEISLAKTTAKQVQPLAALAYKLAKSDPTPEQLAALYRPYSDFVARQKAGIALLRELGAGFLTAEEVNSYEGMVGRALPKVSNPHYLSSKYLAIEQGGVTLAEGAKDRITEENTFKVPPKVQKMIAWAEDWCRLMNDPISQDIRFFNGTKGQPHLVKSGDKMELNLVEVARLCRA
jgi:hypothetical protein